MIEDSGVVVRRTISLENNVYRGWNRTQMNNIAKNTYGCEKICSSLDQRRQPSSDF